MGAFLERYGIAIFVLVIVGIMVLVATPLATQIEGNVKQEVNRFTKTAGEQTDPEAKYNEIIPEGVEVVTLNETEDFKNFVSAVNSNGTYNGVSVANNENVYIKLKGDIDLSEISGFVGIGNGNNYSFDGTFNGYGHTIKNWTVTGNWNYYMALFRTTNGCDVKNLTIENFNLGGATTKGTNYGAVIGCIGGGDVIVENVTVKDTTIKGQRALGAVVGGMTSGALHVNNCTIENVTLYNSGNNIDNNLIAGTLLGKGWSHNDYEEDGFFAENNKISNVKWFAANVEQTEVPEYNYTK